MLLLLPVGFVFSGVLVSSAAGMGAGQTKAKSPLGCMLLHFQEFWADYSVITKMPRKLHTLCELEWPTFNVGWLHAGSFHPPVARRVRVQLQMSLVTLTSGPMSITGNCSLDINRSGYRVDPLNREYSV